MREFQRLKHLGLGDFLRRALDHDNRFTGPGDDKIQVALVHIFNGGVHDEFVVDESHSHRADGAVKGEFGDVRGRGGGVNGHHVGVMDVVRRQYRLADLRFVHEPLRKERPHGPVRQAARKDLAFRGARLPAEEVAGDAPSGVSLFPIVHRHGEEILARPHAGRDRDGREDHRFAAGDQDAAVGLLCNAAGFEDELGRADLHRSSVHLRELHSFGLTHSVRLNQVQERLPPRSN